MNSRFNRFIAITSYIALKYYYYYVFFFILLLFFLGFALSDSQHDPWSRIPPLMLSGFFFMYAYIYIHIYIYIYIYIQLSCDNFWLSVLDYTKMVTMIFVLEYAFAKENISISKVSITEATISKELLFFLGTLFLRKLYLKNFNI